MGTRDVRGQLLTNSPHISMGHTETQRILYSQRDAKTVCIDINPSAARDICSIDKRQTKYTLPVCLPLRSRVFENKQRTTRPIDGTMNLVSSETKMSGVCMCARCRVDKYGIYFVRINLSSEHFQKQLTH